MTQGEQINAFKADIDKVIERYRAEFELPYATVVGILEFVQLELMEEAFEQANDEDDGEEQEF